MNCLRTCWLVGGAWSIWADKRIKTRFICPSGPWQNQQSSHWAVAAPPSPAERKQKPLITNTASLFLSWTETRRAATAVYAGSNSETEFSHTLKLEHQRRRRGSGVGQWNVITDCGHPDTSISCPPNQTSAPSPHNLASPVAGLSSIDTTAGSPIYCIITGVAAVQRAGGKLHIF